LNKAQIIAALKSSRANFMAAIGGLTPDQLLRPGACGLWSVKDVMAHLTAWESELVTALAKLDKNKAPHLVEIEEIDEWNAEQYALTVSRSLEGVQEDFQNVLKQLVRIIEELDEYTLTDPRAIRWNGGDPLYLQISDAAYEHEDEHVVDIKAWRVANGL
jgi:hypothetical protein